MIGEIIFLLLIFAVILQLLLWTTIVQIDQYQAGVALKLAKFDAMLNPGWNFVVPLITQVTKVDLRLQYLDFPNRSFKTNDSQSVNLAATLSYRVADAKKLVLQDTLASSEFQSAFGTSFEEKINNKLSKIIEITLRNFASKNDKIAITSDDFNDSQIIERLTLQVRDIGIVIDNIEILQIENKIEFSEKHLALQEFESKPIMPVNFSALKIFPFVSLEDYEWGVSFRLGKFHEVLDSEKKEGTSELHPVVPFVSKVYALDKRPQVLILPKQEVITRDKSRTNLEVSISYKIKDPKKALLGVADYRCAIIHVAQSSIREYASQTSLYDLTSNQISTDFEKIFDKNLEIIGIEIDDFSKTRIKEIGSSYFVNNTFDKELPLNALKEERMELVYFHNNSIVFGSGFMNLFRNLFTQRSLRLYLGLGFFGLASSNLRKSSSTLYSISTIFYFIISILWFAGVVLFTSYLVSIDEYNRASQVTVDNGGSEMPIQFFYVTFTAFMLISYLFVYLPTIFFLHWPHSYWTKKEFEKSLTDKANQISAVTEEVAKSASISGTLKDLYTLRSDVLKFQEEGMIIGELMNEIEVLENKFVNEAKQNISIEEIAKLQEEFIIGLSPENTL